MMDSEKNDIEGGIRNRVEESGLVQIDLDSLSSIKCVEFDFTDWLWEGVIVKEKEFREKAKDLNTEDFIGLGVGITCTQEAIVPDWAWMLVSSKLSSAAFVVVGGLENAHLEALNRAIESLSPEEYYDKRVVIRGCANSGGANALVQIQQKLQPVVKSLMFGEACSTVPIYKSVPHKK
jgi:hypothetical protein